MGEMSTAESLLAVIGAAVGTVFGIWRIVESTRGGIEKSLQENDELDLRDRCLLRAMLDVVGRRANGVSRCAVVVRARFLRSFLVSASSAPVVAPRWPDGPARRPSPPGSGEGSATSSPTILPAGHGARRTPPPPRGRLGERGHKRELPNAAAERYRRRYRR